MFCIVARLSRRARTMPRRSPLVMVTSALSMAMSVPVPIAMPTSARASAGASLMPSVVEVPHVGKGKVAFARAGDDGGSQGMLADVFEARGQAQQRGFVDTRLPVDGHESRLAFGQRAGLVHHKRRDLLQHLETALHH